MQPITAVIPTFNRSALTVRAVESVLAQSAPPAEVLVIDDGSTDDTCTRLAACGDAVRVVRQSNAGAAAARNHGVREARHPWIAFLDSDDVWMPEHLARMQSALEATGGRALCYFADMRLPTGASWFEACGFAPAAPHELCEHALAWAFLSWQPMMLQASVFQRAGYGELAGLDEALPTREDTHLFFRAAARGPLCALSDIGCEMTADAGDGRLTAAHPGLSLVYEEATVRLYADLLQQPLGFADEERRELARRLAAGRWRLGRARLQSGALLPGALELARSVVAGELTRRALQRVRRSA